MDTAAIDRLIDSVLYEGYLLYPYRPAIKNNMRWTFGGLYPREWSEADPGRDRWSARTQLVVEAAPAATIELQIRFLHVVDRHVTRREADRFHAVPELEVNGVPHHSGQECTERRVEFCASLEQLLKPQAIPFRFPAEVAEEDLLSADGSRVGTIVRRQAELQGTIEVVASGAGPECRLLSLSIANESRMPALLDAPDRGAREATERSAAVLRALASTHAVVRILAGRFVSQVDPPAERRMLTESCRSDGLWPVLVGDSSLRDTMLCSPIILYDYPEIAPESQGDFFDATEIDEMLTLRVLTLSDEERRHVEAFDERGHALLARTHALAERQMADLHGATRCLKPMGGLADDR